VSVAVWPEHTAVGVAVTVSVGELVITTATVCVAVQVPFAPVTVYVVFTVGATVAVGAVTLPAFALHVYEVAPDAVSVAVWPEHTAVGVAVTVSVGPLVITTATVCVLVHVPFAPVTV
jgi:hypothetical protein